MSKTYTEITDELKSASAEMLRSLENDELTESEKAEWYGYLRALRDVAYFMGVSEQTDTQLNLDKALKHVMPQTPVNCEEPTNA